MTRITRRPQPSGAMTVDSAREPARRAVGAAIGLSARTEKAKEGNARLTTSLLASVLLGSARLLLLPPAASAVPAKLTDDAYTKLGSSTNFGSQGVLHVIGGSNQKSWLKFDLTTLPMGTTGSQVAKATLRLFADSVATGGMITVNHATSAWTEGTVNGMPEPFVSATQDAAFVVCPSTSPPCATISISACHHRAHQGDDLASEMRMK
jgi:hypothetical protein